MGPFGTERRRRAPLRRRLSRRRSRALTDFLETHGIRLAGRATGHNLLEYPLGRFPRNRPRHGSIVEPPPRACRLHGRATPPIRPRSATGERLGPRVGTVRTARLLEPRADWRQAHATPRARWIEIGAEPPRDAADLRRPSRADGLGRGSTLPFHVTSADWQESDRLLAGIISAFGSDTRAMPIGGARQLRRGR